jgi:hypothetical protein
MAIKTEKETRKHLLKIAQQNGCETEFRKILAQFDEMLKHAKTPEERRALQDYGVLEIYKLFGNAGELIVDGRKLK